MIVVVSDGHNVAHTSCLQFIGHVGSTLAAEAVADPEDRAREQAADTNGIRESFL